jgi:gamma-glutamylcyclotransferase (GGCT)/AIG2-like uncharacterized protein YtfP
MGNDYLFVYGTLRRDSRSEMHQFLADHADFLDEGVFAGRLYMVNQYPGAVPSDQAAENVRGEVYRLSDPSIVFPRLDTYEECGSGFTAPAEYVRQLGTVSLRSGRKVEAWIYIYNRATEGLCRIETGDFLNRSR